MKKIIGILNLKILSIIGIILTWFIVSRYSNPLFLPKPEQVWNSFVILIQNGELIKSLTVSFTRITVATILSTLFSVPIGLLGANFKCVDSLITPTTNGLRFLPITALFPLLMMWFGIGESMRIIFLFLATFVYFLPSVILCIKDVSSDLIDTAYTIGMSKLQVMLKVQLPAALPSMCQNFLMMYGIGWTYVIIAEIINTNVGLGHLINIASARGATSLVFVSIFAILLVSYLFDACGNALIKNSFKWKFSHEED